MLNFIFTHPVTSNGIVYCFSPSVYWSAPLGKDSYRPKPIGSFSFCKFAYHKAILFGGNGCEDDGHSHSNRLYQFDLENRVSRIFRSQLSKTYIYVNVFFFRCGLALLHFVNRGQLGADSTRSLHYLIPRLGQLNLNHLTGWSFCGVK